MDFLMMDHLFRNEDIGTHSETLCQHESGTLWDQSLVTSGRKERMYWKHASSLEVMYQQWSLAKIGLGNMWLKPRLSGVGVLYSCSH